MKLAEVAGLSMQDYFSGTVGYLRRQERMSVSGERCVYLADDGNRCAVGYWIPDGHPAQECNVSVSSLALEYPVLAGVAWPCGDDGVRLAQELQRLHDGGRFRLGFGHEGGLSRRGEERARWIAEDFGLTYSPPVESTGSGVS